METKHLELLKKFDVSCETIQKLKLFRVELLKWNSKINLISKETESDIWVRHIIDSLQISPFLNKNKKILDIGSGAGMPGMILALSGFDVVLVEKSFKKQQFLSRIKSITNVKVGILAQEFERDAQISGAEFITCRAVCKIKEIIELTKPYFDLGVKYVLLKGKTYDAEIKEALCEYDFGYQIHDSCTSEEGKIVTLSIND